MFTFLSLTWCLFATLNTEQVKTLEHKHLLITGSVLLQWTTPNLSGLTQRPRVLPRSSAISGQSGTLDWSFISTKTSPVTDTGKGPQQSFQSLWRAPAYKWCTSLLLTSHQSRLSTAGKYNLTIFPEGRKLEISVQRIKVVREELLFIMN